MLGLYTVTQTLYSILSSVNPGTSKNPQWFRAKRLGAVPHPTCYIVGLYDPTSFA